ncbi:MAG TPA: 23S rRNA (pseudouridine(1915)-N(3))-methyltransferase RlmH [Chthoniobacteraceae bacterium]|jgi:23S rRNA (pseudouridine1915-N3)-methyltransferase|nr:23S rRNA (pseudouridine(1915)-N(3))-methyltransferase RlmH [Chthoniobacteraceae bacterium]
MQWHVFAIGKPKLGFAREGVEEYAKRLRPLAPVTIDYVKPAGGETESAALLRRSEGMHRIAMDERGRQWTSMEFAAQVAQWEMERIKSVALLIGGADGHSEELRAKANVLWSLGKLTLQHELALVVVIEQLYRAYSIKAGTSYHREG